MKILFLALVLLVCAGLAAQQDAQYTQFMYNKLGFNPAFAGAEPSTTLQAVVRQQWIGFEDAPSSQLFTFNSPMTANGTGVGARLSRVTIGLEQQYNVEGSYAYRIPIGRGSRLGLGVSASARYFNVEYQDATPIQGGGIDPAIPGATESKVVPNFGAGIFIDGPSYYVGISAPRLLENNIDLGAEETIISREARHYYFMGGYTFTLNEKLRLQPQMLAKYVSGAPFDADFNVTAYVGTNLFGGASYRLGGNGGGESASALLGFYLSEHLNMCFSYDLGLSDLKSAQNGSVELAVGYSFGGRGDAGRVVDPRDLR
ncbi:type IX secretion system membrane protein PorP/SprF [Neolewinella lacunae]|uniref:Type IX secretion system membrane protein PorP/SprF n=1 Tax=Neolewinella lacunae TaxID=1517758 RepID=A0A923T889_9BACT|nr:type IX secretion system membrane protein PorP/SprF [Neolewinella lacunae]MBC6993703.1 type IX secretion system membrane protein PorP/SprF [Neolewinella lacunae]MDN3636123.1 type IX secretion system membrane protein PorP/SprF [Neolewinella lacunae]